MGQPFELLPIKERAEHYREMADVTYLKAKKLKDPELREGYLNMAANWHTLAQALEAGDPDPELALLASAPSEPLDPPEVGE